MVEVNLTVLGDPQWQNAEAETRAVNLIHSVGLTKDKYSVNQWCDICASQLISLKAEVERVKKLVKSAELFNNVEEDHF